MSRMSGDRRSRRGGVTFVGAAASRSATDLAVEAAVADVGVITLFEDRLRPYLVGGAREPVLGPRWPRFPGPHLYYPDRWLVPAPLRAFIDVVKAVDGAGTCT